MIISPNQILAAEESRLLASTREPVTSSAASERLRETCADAISHPSEWYRTPPDAPLTLLDFMSTLIGWALAVLAIILVAHWLTGGHWR